MSMVSKTTGEDAQIVLSETSGNFLAGMQWTAGTVTGADAVSVNFSAPVGSSGTHLDEAITSGVFTLNGTKFYIDSAADSLQTILARINASDTGVSAGYDNASGKISFYQKSSGAANSIVLGAAGDTSNLFHALKLSASAIPVGALADTYTGVNAQVSLNGGTAQAFDSNSIEGLIPGVTLDLNKTGSVSIQISSDTDSVVNAANDFVDKYNAVMGFINEKLDEEPIKDAKTPEDKLAGAFRNDAIFLSARYDFQRMVSGSVSGLSGEMNMLAQAGITFTSDNNGKDGTLKLSGTDLRQVLKDDPESVSTVFRNIMSSLDTKLESMTDYVFGSITQAKNGLDEEQEYLNDRISEMQKRLDSYQTMLKTQFANMENLVARLKAQGTQLSNLLGVSS
jgi:flagellar hook-associated protein 2